MKKNKANPKTNYSIPDIELIDLDTENLPGSLPTQKSSYNTPILKEDSVLEDFNMEENFYEENDDDTQEDFYEENNADTQEDFYEDDADDTQEDFYEEDADDTQEDFYEEDNADAQEDFYEDDADTQEDFYEEDNANIERRRDREARFLLQNSLKNKKEKKPFFQRINWHIVFLLTVVLLFGLVIYRIKTFGSLIDLNQLTGNSDLEVLDSILPVFPKDGVVPQGIDDGVTTILAFGNAPFADDRNSENSLAHLIEEKSDAVVYNCSVEGTYLAAIEESLYPDKTPIDAFNFYWLTTLMCMRDNDLILDNYARTFAAYKDLGLKEPEGAREAYQTLTTIDYNKVDVVVLMYDGSDYLAGHNMYDDNNPTDIQCFTGNMEAGISLIQETYPHIRIIVLSPTYAFGIDENGNYISSDLQRYGQDVLSTYVIKQYDSAYVRFVSFIDNIYGTFTEDNAKDYLIDNIHLNPKGRSLVADRFVYALNYYNKD